MLSRSTILSAMQFSTVNGVAPFNTGSDSRYTFTYQFAGTSEPVDFNEVTSTDYSGWSNWAAAEKAQFREALALIETFLNVEFVEVTGSSDPDINVGRVSIPGSTIGVGGYSYSYTTYPDTHMTRYDAMVVFDKTWNLTDAMDLYLHEMGHALTLKHPFSGSDTLPGAYDNDQWTVMSYTTNGVTNVPTTAMMAFDVLALQDRWGAADYNTGDTTYTGPRNDTFDLVWDSGGTDTFDASDNDQAVVIELRQAVFSQFTGRDDVVIAFDAVIENAIGSRYNDSLRGNGSANSLSGGNGADRLIGLGGHDSLDGGNSNDTLIGGGGADTLNGGFGRDLLFGQAGNDWLTGGADRDVFLFDAMGGNDRILDYEAGTDVIRMRGLGLVDAEDAMTHATQVGSWVVFDFGADGHIRVANSILAEVADGLTIV